MAHTIDITGLRAYRRAATQFYFDLACPFSYLAAERAEAVFTELLWTPAAGLRLSSIEAPDPERAAQAAMRRAMALGLPLVWPERWPDGVPAAMRAATYAVTTRRAGAFVLAASRLAFCGGYDLDEPAVLAEAAAAAGIDVDLCLAAAREGGRDATVRAAALRLRADGAEHVPALRVGGLLFSGEGRVVAAAAMARRQRGVDRLA